MSENIFIIAAVFLINTTLNIFVFVLLIRFMLALAQANYFHPLTQFVSKCSNWLVKPLRKVVPNIRQIETASLIWIIVIEFVKLSVVNSLSMGIPNLVGILFLSIGETLDFLIQIYIFAIIIQAILSFIQPQSPANFMLQQLVSPVMRPIRRFIPLINGIDISPIPAIILLQLLNIIIANPIMLYGIGLAY